MGGIFSGDPTVLALPTRQFPRKLGESQILEFLCILAGALDVAIIACAVAKYWRISVGCIVAASAVGIVCVLSSSPAIRGLVGFHLVVLVTMAGIVWELNPGRLKD